MRKQVSTFKPDSNIEGVSPSDIMDNSIEDRHLSDNEILPKKIAMVEDKVAVPIVIDFEITEDASAGLAIFDAAAPFNMEIVDVKVQARATSGGGTAKITDGTNDISDAIACATDNAIGRAASLDDAYSTIAAGGTLKVVTANAADRGLVTITAIKRD